MFKFRRSREKSNPGQLAPLPERSIGDRLKLARVIAVVKQIGPNIKLLAAKVKVPLHFRRQHSPSDLLGPLPEDAPAWSMKLRQVMGVFKRIGAKISLPAQFRWQRRGDEALLSPLGASSIKPWLSWDGVRHLGGEIWLKIKQFPARFRHDDPVEGTAQTIARVANRIASAQNIDQNNG